MLRLVFLAAALIATASAQTTATVTSTADAGSGSLRSAIQAVNGAGGGRVEFDIPGDGVQTIRLQSNLPEIAVPIEIDGLTQPGAACAPLPTDLRIEIIGSDIPVTPGGPHRIFVLTGGASTVRGVSLHGIPSYLDPGVGSLNSTLLRVEGSGNLIECNLVDVPPAGGAPEPSVRAVGLFVGTAASGDNVVAYNVVGAPALTMSVSGSRNRIQGNRIGWTGPDALTVAGPTAGAGTSGPSVSISGADAIVGGTGDGEGNLFAGRLTLTGTGHLVQGNWVSLDANGDPVDLTGGILLGVTGGTSSNPSIIPTDIQIGGRAPGAGNVTTFLDIHRDAERITVQGNRFGTDATGMALHPHARKTDADGTDILIDGTGEGEGNQFAVGEDEALSAFRAEGLVLEGNLFGTDATGLGRLGSGEVRISSGTGNRVGGAAPGSGNVIATQLTLSSETDPVVQRNHIGVDATGQVAFEGASNFADGISVFGGSGATIGGASGEGNVVTGDFAAISLSTTTGARVLGNRVGTDASGTRALRLPFSGISLYESSDNEIGGTAPGAGNVLAGSRSASETTGAIRMSRGSDRNRVLGNWIGTSPDLETAFPFAASGIVADSSYQNVIGLPEAPNIVAHTGGPAVYILDVGTGNAVSGLLAFDTGLPAIDLDGTTDGPTPNDSGDADEGPNRLQNAPAIVTASATSAEVTATYAVDTAPVNASYPLRIEAFAVYSNAAVHLGSDEIPEGEAQVEREVTFALDAPLGPGAALVLTATDADDNTGESSEPRGLTPPVDAEGGPDAVSFAIVASPNPARDRLAIGVVGAEPSGARVRIEIFDALGRRVVVTKGASTRATLVDVSGLAPGAYVVRATSETRAATQIVTVAR